MRGRSLSGLLVGLTVMLAAACFDPLFDENQPSAGEKSLCCAEATHTLDTHIAAPGELASSRIFPGCQCYAGSRCSPFYKAAAGGACYPLQPGSQDAGVSTVDGGASVADGGSGASDAGGAVDAGALTDWAACCVGGQITTCLCPVVGDCAASNFRLCGGQTCSTSGNCTAQ